MQLFSSYSKREKAREQQDFDAIRIGIASPEKILSWSHGEVTKAETINYRTFKPEKDGLFCARIFGPLSDFECLCGKYKRMKYRGIVCDRCGVEVTRARVRRERMGHITLASRVSHIWFFRGLPSKIGNLLDISIKDLEKILYFASYIVIDPGNTPLKEKQLLSEEEYRSYLDEYGEGSFEAKIGADAIYELLSRLDLEELAAELRYIMKSNGSYIRKLRATKRLKIVEALRESNNRPEWMILEVIPVIPPELRPLVPLEGGKFAISDLNDLYRRVINRNNRLKKLIELEAPDVIIRNEKRMLQEAVDALFDNGKRGKVIKGSHSRPLKSLADSLKGKQGRFRQNLLGKRVDYSGRSVIVVGPQLKMYQCGIPKPMLLELFKPFIYSWLEKKGYASTIKMAKEIVEREEDIVWEAVEEIIKDHPLLLNRAPTLHKLGIQAFMPVIVEGKAIQIHPLVCAAFNADFDGDQMAVHVPLSPKAQAESALIMLSTHNILSPAHGKPLAVPSQDLVLGGYYLTLSSLRESEPEKMKEFSDLNEVLLAYELGMVDTHERIRVRYTGQLIDLEVLQDTQDISSVEPQEVKDDYIETTVGRVILNSVLPDEVPFVNGVLKKKGLQELVDYCYHRLDRKTMIKMLDDFKDLTFYYATKAGISFGMDDMVVPPSKEKILRQSRKEVMDVERQLAEGAITTVERRNKILDVWHRTTEKVTEEMFKAMKQRELVTGEFNPIYLMTDSGARGSREQVRQLAGMRGLMSKPSGEIIETPITSSFAEGLSVLEYFISTHGARKGLADTALKTADSGYLTRRLVDVAQEVIVQEEDCGTIDGMYVSAIFEGGTILESLYERIVGRIAQETVIDPFTGEVIVDVGEEITEEKAKRIEEVGIEKVLIRSVLTCETVRGVCAKCYGRDLSTGKLVEVGEAVGIIAAQSIGEPGTQLTMRTFHYGGTASRVSERSSHVAKHDGIVEFRNVRTIVDKEGWNVVVSHNSKLVITDKRQKVREIYELPYGAKLFVNDGDKVKQGDTLVEWDPFSSVIITEVSGRVKYLDIVKGENLREEVDRLTGISYWIIVESAAQDKRTPAVIIESEDKSVRYYLPAGAYILVKDGDEVSAGDIIAKNPKEEVKTQDITGGLPRVVELFEARNPKDAAVISDIDGVVEVDESGVSKGHHKIKIKGYSGEEKVYLVPKSKHVIVSSGQHIRAGDPITRGSINPHDVLRVLGEKEVQRFLVARIQEVYRAQSVNINDKHIEIIVRQMMQFVKIEDVGDTRFVLDEQVEKWRFEEENRRVKAQGGVPAKGKTLLLSITKASLTTDSWISAASFQETTRILTDAAVAGKVDTLKGLKENVIVGKLIPAGTGFRKYNEIVDKVLPDKEEIEIEIEEESELTL